MSNIRTLTKTCAGALAGGVLGAGVLLAGAGAVHAQEAFPKGFIPLPAGTSLAIGYYIYQHDNEFTINTGPTYTKNTGREVNLSVGEYVHYVEVAGHPAGFKIIQTFGSLSGAQINGRSVGSAFGAQNTALSAFIWPYVDFQHHAYLVTYGYLYPPDGTYDQHSPINVGDNRWRGDIAVGFDKAFGPRFSFDVGFDTMFYGDNDNPFNNGHLPPGARLSQDNTYRGQVFLNWNFSRSVWGSIGWEGFFGGVQYLNGSANGSATKEQRLRADLSAFVTPAAKVLLELNHDVQVSGGFKQDLGATMRLVYAF